MPNRIPLDPKLPTRFYDTPNEERSKAQLDAWWDHPYGILREDGEIDVYCLNGGAWDRPTWLGRAADRDQADKVAEVRQAKWLRFRNRPTLLASGAGAKQKVVLLPQRPDEDMRVLAEFDEFQEAAAYMDTNYPADLPAPIAQPEEQGTPGQVAPAADH